MKILDEARLWFQEGKSDKVYEIDLVEVAGGQHVVNFRYGRRGTALRDGTKTPVPVSLEKARAVFAALVDEKRKGGYRAQGEGAPTGAPAAPRRSSGGKNKRAAREQRTREELMASLQQGMRSEVPIALVVRRVGERAMREAEPFLLELLAANKTPHGLKPVVWGFTLVTALARCGSTAAIAPLRELIDTKMTPRFLRDAARLALLMVVGAAQRESYRALVPAQLLPSADITAQVHALERLIITKPKEGHAATFALYLLANASSAVDEGDELARAARRMVLAVTRVVRLEGEEIGIARTLTWAAELRGDAELFALLARRFETEPGARYNKTINYFRRRTARVLRRLGRRSSPDYVKLASELLLQYRDQHAEPVVESSYGTWDAFARYWALNFVIYGKSKRYRASDHQRATWVCTGNYRPGGPAPKQREEWFPDLWDAAPEALWRIASSEAATPVILFATRALRDQQEFLSKLSDEQLAHGMSHGHALLRQLAFEIARARPLNLTLVKGALSAGIAEADAWALAWLETQTTLLTSDAELVVLLITSRSAKVRDAGARLALSATLEPAVARAVVLRAVAVLMGLSPAPDAEERAQSAAAFLIAALPHALADLSLNVLKDLLAHSVSAVAAFGAELVVLRARSGPLEEGLLQALLDSRHAAVRAHGARILGETPPELVKDSPELLVHFALSANAELREGTRALLGEVARRYPVVGRQLAVELLAALLEPQAQGAPAHVVSLLRKELSACLPSLQSNEVLALIGALSPHAREAGGLLLAHVSQDSLSLQDIVRLANHEVLEIRRSAWKLASAARERWLLSPVALARLCDARWEDSRVFAFELVRSFAPEALVPDTVIAICDSVLPEVERFGQTLMLEYWKEEHAVRYLLRLSEHPSSNIQLLVSGLLERHARGKLELLSELVPYLATVLSQVNRGAVAKQRVLAFVRAEANSSAEAAALLAPLLDRQSATSAITHKAPLITTMVEVHAKHPDVPLPIVVVTPDFARAPTFAPRPTHTRSSRGV
jgi:hypothetical protein